MDKVEILEKLAEITAAVEALPDDTHAGQDPLPMTARELNAFTNEQARQAFVPAPVWRTLTFGDLRAGDVVKLDEDGDEETVRTGTPVRVVDVTWIRTDRSCGYYPDEDPVLVRHPQPEVGQ